MGKLVQSLEQQFTDYPKLSTATWDYILRAIKWDEILQFQVLLYLISDQTAYTRLSIQIAYCIL